MKLKYIYIITIVCAATFLVSCGDDDVDSGNSVFNVERLAAQNEFDLWLESCFRATYNTRVAYKFDYMDTDFSYNLTPPGFSKATNFAQIMKYCWFELYDEVGGMHFTRETAPKQIYLIGSQGIDFATGTATLATASGGLRVVIYDLNAVKTFTYTNVKSYMHIMHHEFSHILDQKKNKDLTFGAISEKDYVGDNWTNYSSSTKLPEANKLGFVTAYAASEPNEDYAEVYSKYITLTDTEWEAILKSATDGSNTYGRDVILNKVKLISEYLRDSWDIDLEVLRECSLRRALKSTDIEFIEFNEFGNK